MERTAGSGPSQSADAPAGERYLLLADISGFTTFFADVQSVHGADFGEGVPAAYPTIAALLNTIIVGVEPDFSVVKLEGDAVFAAASAASLDGQGDRVLETLGTMYREFVDARTQAIPSSDHVCTACPAVANLDLKAILHRGPAVRQTVGTESDLIGPSVTLAHRLLKNNVRARIGFHPYVFLTDAAASGLGLSESGLAHIEEYPDAGQVQGRIVGLGEPLPEVASA